MKLKIDDLTKEALQAQATEHFSGAVTALLMRMPEIAEKLELIVSGQKRLSLKIETKTLSDPDASLAVTHIDFVIRDAEPAQLVQPADEAV